MAEPENMTELYRAIWQVLTDGTPVVVTSHARLDGDGAGSSLALWHALRMRGVEAYHFFPPPISSVFDFLPGMQERCADAGQLPAAYHLVVLDSGTFERVGGSADALAGSVRIVNIDHHDSNSQFGHVNWVDPTASSCAEMIRPLLAAGGVELTPQIAECLFAAIVSDTGHFSHQDTTPEAFAICAECVRAGARPHELMRELFFSPSPAQIRLQQLALSSLRFYCDGQIATVEVTQEMFERTGLEPVDTEGFTEVAISIQGVQASALLKEMPGCDYIKVSMRSRDAIDVCAVAQAFGGGGHVHAAGCEIEGTLDKARELVVNELRLQLQTCRQL